jgi:hypothetical protein
MIGRIGLTFDLLVLVAVFFLFETGNQILYAFYAGKVQKAILQRNIGQFYIAKYQRQQFNINAQVCVCAAGCRGLSAQRLYRQMIPC